MKSYKNSHGQTVKITPGIVRYLRKRSTNAVKSEVLEVVERISNKGLCVNSAIVLENVGFELNVRLDTVMEVMKELCGKGLLNKLGKEYQMLRTVQEDDYK